MALAVGADQVLRVAGLAVGLDAVGRSTCGQCMGEDRAATVAVAAVERLALSAGADDRAVGGGEAVAVGAVVCRHDCCHLLLLCGELLQHQVAVLCCRAELLETVQASGAQCCL